VISARAAGTSMEKRPSSSATSSAAQSFTPCSGTSRTARSAPSSPVLKRSTIVTSSPLAFNLPAQSPRSVSMSACVSVGVSAGRKDSGSFAPSCVHSPSSTPSRKVPA
jgi:hypothetical protein